MANGWFDPKAREELWFLPEVIAEGWWDYLLLDDVPADPTRTAQVSFGELEVPLAPDNAKVSFVEFEVPNIPQATARVSFAEFEVPFPPSCAQISFAEFEVPAEVPRQCLLSFAELEVPYLAHMGRLRAKSLVHRAMISFAELEVP